MERAQITLMALRIITSSQDQKGGSCIIEATPCMMYAVQLMLNLAFNTEIVSHDQCGVLRGQTEKKIRASIFCFVMSHASRATKLLALA